MDKSPSESPSIHVRPFRKEDMPLVVNSWIESYRSSRETWGWNKDEYCEVQTQVIKALMKRCNVAIACDPEDHDHVFGWAAWENHDRYIIVHFAYTKFLFQRMGVQRKLWTEVVNPEGLDVIATHAGPDAYGLKKAGFRFWIKPFALAAALIGTKKEEEK